MRVNKDVMCRAVQDCAQRDAQMLALWPVPLAIAHHQFRAGNPDFDCDVVSVASLLAVLRQRNKDLAACNAVEQLAEV